MDIFNDQEAIYYLNSNALAIPEVTTLARYVEKGMLTPCFYYVGILNRTIMHHDELKKQ